ncbi:nucleolar protein 4-like b isoform X1 [Tachysurus ichikawai]
MFKSQKRNALKPPRRRNVCTSTLFQMIDCKHTANILVHSDPVVSPENDRPASLAPDLIDYNMPLTTTYLKQMKLQCINNNERVNLILRSLVLTDHSSEC